MTTLEPCELFDIQDVIEARTIRTLERTQPDGFALAAGLSMAEQLGIGEWLE